MQCASTTFRINNAGIAGFTQAKVGTNCSEDYIGIEGSSQTGFGNFQSRYCGGFLNNFDTATTDAKIKGTLFEIEEKQSRVTLILSIFCLDCTSPFEISVVTDATQDAAAPTAANIGKFYSCDST